MPAGIPYEEARKCYRPGVTPPVRSDDGTVEALLKGFHPDHGPNARVALAVGVPLNLNTQFMGSGRAHRGGILAGHNVTAEGDGLFVSSLQSTRMNQTIEVANVRVGSKCEELNVKRGRDGHC